MDFKPAPPTESLEAIALRLAEHIHQSVDAQPKRKQEESEKYWLDLYAKCLRVAQGGG